MGAIDVDPPADYRSENDHPDPCRGAVQDLRQEKDQAAGEEG
jgi:hypothetical protein